MGEKSLKTADGNHQQSEYDGLVIAPHDVVHPGACHHPVKIGARINPQQHTAAEHASPDQYEWRNRYTGFSTQLRNQLQRHLHEASDKIKNLQGRLFRQHPQQRLLQQSQRLDELTQRLVQSEAYRRMQLKSRLESLQSRFNSQSPTLRLERVKFQSKNLRERLYRNLQERLQQQRNRR